MKGEDIRPGQRTVIEQLRCWEKGGDLSGKLPLSCFSHTIESKTSQNKDSERYVCQPLSTIPV